MGKTILITGIAGHLGHAIVKELSGKGFQIRGLLFKGEKPDPEWLVKDSGMSFYYGNVADADSLSAFFAGLENQEAYLIHTASLIDIQHRKMTDRLMQTNVNGTINISNAAKNFTSGEPSISLPLIPSKQKTNVWMKILPMLQTLKAVVTPYLNRWQIKNA